MEAMLEGFMTYAKREPNISCKSSEGHVKKVKCLFQQASALLSGCSNNVKHNQPADDFQRRNTLRKPTHGKNKFKVCLAWTSPCIDKVKDANYLMLCYNE